MVKPIAAILVLDLAILVWWTLDDKAALKWVRLPKTVDTFGNVLESTGLCRSESPWLQGGLILALHFSVLVYGNYMCYKSRHAGTAFSESKYVFMCMVSNLQIMALGVPMLIMVYDNPVSNYFMRTAIIFMNDVGVMCLIFLPKFQLVFFGSSQDLEKSTATSNHTSDGSSDASDKGGSSNSMADEGRIADLQANVDRLERENALLTRINNKKEEERNKNLVVVEGAQVFQVVE